jgi:hypothetical protein
MFATVIRTFSEPRAFHRVDHRHRIGVVLLEELRVET